MRSEAKFQEACEIGRLALEREKILLDAMNTILRWDNADTMKQLARETLAGLDARPEGNKPPPSAGQAEKGEG